MLGLNESWLAPVPKTWQVRKFYQTFRLKSGVAITSDRISPDDAFPVYGGNGLRGYTDDYTHDGTYLLIGRQGALCGNVHMVSEKIWASEHALVVYPTIKLDQRWLFYVLQTMDLGQYSMATAQPGLSVDNLSTLRLPVPPTELQTKIAQYLDLRCGEIDDLIAKKRSLLALLAEKRSALITRAVTKGLDPTARTKPSGIDSLGDIPAQWEARRLRFVGRAQNGINIGGEFFGKGYPFVSYSDVFKNFELPQEVTGLVESSDADRNRYTVRSGDIFFTRTSETIEEIGMSSVCLKAIPNATFAGFLIRVRPYPNILLPEFSKFYFRNTSLRAFLVKEMNLVTRASLSQTLLGNIPVLIPPREDQEKIAAFINENLAALNDVASNIENAIERLTEYRAAIITKAVTGELEVT
ncbi:restriction endonuclease subunit S [Rhizobium ruizarguesonis]|uniref:restriction endonuclease subunit S n=1 Tax=Rhizobium ruizarguesonis TaxID=2081791 RepID=UPI001FE0AA24|nr:restriction endonuclease subunit S [Rhizobium ruizarguesonis]